MADPARATDDYRAHPVGAVIDVPAFDEDAPPGAIDTLTIEARRESASGSVWYEARDARGRVRSVSWMDAPRLHVEGH